ncbi:insecticidal delta-endotoxin Cry8Ea1 family protein, partial [Bacillus wiedmannii]|uniref:insecticidal delta-endotoxin Cry8Ea1 family protein n=1 Tax=Bacillus wiedmannii TaxID=1890302 RepID=UPI003D210C3E
MGGLLMNQNYNNTEYEIMDNGAREYQPRYPLAQAPGSELQNMNNQDVMNTCIERTYDIAQQQNTQQAVLVATGITFKILGLASPALSAAGGVIQSIIKLLWPKPNNQEVWDSFMNAVEALIDQKIEQYARNKAIAELEGLENILEEYEDVLKIYNAEPTVAHRERLRNLVISIDLFFENSMPSFRVAGQEVPLLTVFANAANLHLAFLRDIVQFGSEWGFSQLEIDDFYKNGLEELTQKYTDHCVNTYNKGLEQSKTLTADLCNFNQYPWTRYNQGFREEEKPNCSSQQISQRFDEQVNPSMASVRWSQTEYRGLENWNLYNAFRRDMTIMVLDIVSLWPTYNPRLYNNLNGVRSELTRELYTDIRGTTYRSDASQNSLSAIEERMIPKPSLFKWLTQLHFYWRQLGNA